MANPTTDYRKLGPLGKAHDWKQEMAYQAEILEGLGRDPSHERDVASDLYSDAKAKRRRITQDAWDLRKIERFVPHAGMTASAVAEAVNLAQAVA